MKISVFIKRNIHLFLKNKDYITKIVDDIKSGKSERGGFKKKSEKARSSNEGDTFAI